MPDGLCVVIARSGAHGQWRVTNFLERHVAEKVARIAFERGQEVKIAHIAFDSIEDFNG